MQRDTNFFNGKVSSTDAYGVGAHMHNTPFGGHYTYGAPVAPAFGAVLAGTKHDFHPSPLNGVEFEPTETCPKNFIIFDQTEDKSRVMFHPTLAHKLNCPDNFNYCAAHAHEGGKTTEKNDEEEDQFSSLKEDTADIDALLSSDEDDEEDDVVSTGRTPTNWGGSSPDSSYSAKGVKSTSQTSFSSDASSSGSERKRERMRKMVEALRGIIPGGERMDTSAVLDEAVKYLKSLKVEVKKLGIQNFKN